MSKMKIPRLLSKFRSHLASTSLSVAYMFASSFAFVANSDHKRKRMNPFTAFGSPQTQCYADVDVDRLRKLKALHVLANNPIYLDFLTGCIVLGNNPWPTPCSNTLKTNTLVIRGINDLNQNVFSALWHRGRNAQKKWPKIAFGTFFQVHTKLGGFFRFLSFFVLFSLEYLILFSEYHVHVHLHQISYLWFSTSLMTACLWSDKTLHCRARFRVFCWMKQERHLKDAQVQFKFNESVN